MKQFQHYFPCGYIRVLTVNFDISSAVASVPILGGKEGDNQVVSVVSLAACAKLLGQRSITSALQSDMDTYTRLK